MVSAAVCRRFGEPLTIEDIAIGSPDDDQVLIDVRACAICHSDISFAKGEWGGDLPAVYGHEAAGVIRETGANVSNYRPGDRVLATLIRSCGHCHYCESGSQILCESDLDHGRSVLTCADSSEPLTQGLRTGAFASRILVHKSQIAAIPDDLPFDQASLISCGALTGYGAVFNTAKVRPATAAVIVGCGGVGLNAIQSAKLAGATPIIAVDLERSKREAALQFGATHAVDPAAEDLVEAVRALTGGRGAPNIFVTVGAKVAIENAMQYLAHSGQLVIVGMPPVGVMASFEPASFAGYNQRILGSKMGEARIERDVPAIIAAWRSGAFQLEPLISGRYPLERINEAMDAVIRGEALRNVIVFEEAAEAAEAA